jgi:hypothetical protein
MFGITPKVKSQHEMCPKIREEAAIHPQKQPPRAVAAPKASLPKRDRT